MRYRVTTKTGEVHEFNSPFQPDSLRKSMNLPLTHKIEVIEVIEDTPKEISNDGQEDAAA